MKRRAVSAIFLPILLASAFTLVLWLQQPLTSASTVTATINVGDHPYGLAVTPNGAYVYVTNARSDTVSVISTATNTVTATINVGDTPQGVAITPDGTHVYVANFYGTVSVISTATNTVTATINVGGYPMCVAVTPDGEHAYVTNQENNPVTVISTATNTVTATINVGSGPYGVAVTPDGAYAYVTNYISDTVSVIRTATNTVTATINVGDFPYGVAITPNGAYAYVTNWGDGTVSVISTATNTVTATAKINVGSGPFCVAITPDGAYAYVPHWGDGVESGAVSVISTTTNTVTETINVQSHPYGVAITPNGAYAYVTNTDSSTVSVISTLTVSVPLDFWDMDMGQSKMFTANASGGSSIYTSYQWYVDSVPQNGQTTSTFSYAPASEGVYLITVTVTDSNSLTSAPSNTVTVVVSAAPTVSISPVGPLTMDVNQSQRFTAAASGGTSMLLYQWYLDGVLVSGQTASTFTYTAAELASHTIYVRVTDYASPPVTVQSNSVSVTVNSALVAPTVSASPGMVNLGQNSSLTSSSVTTGTSPYTYRWLSRAPVAGYYSLISGATSSSYTFVTSGSTAAGAWSFELQVIDSSNTPAVVTSSGASVTVNAALTVTVSPSSWTMDVGQSKIFSAIASGGSGNYTSYQWYVNAVAQSGENASTFSYAPGSEGSYLITVTVTDSLGTTSVQSSASSVMVGAALTVNITPFGPVTLDGGQSKAFTAAPAGGSGTIHYQWYLGGSTPVGTDSSTYSFSESVGSYSVTCKVTDSASVPVTSAASNAVSVIVNPTPLLNVNYMPSQAPTEGSICYPEPAALAMVINYWNRSVTYDEVFGNTPTLRDITISTTGARSFVRGGDVDSNIVYPIASPIPDAMISYPKSLGYNVTEVNGTIGLIEHYVDLGIPVVTYCYTMSDYNNGIPVFRGGTTYRVIIGYHDDQMIVHDPSIATNAINFSIPYAYFAYEWKANSNWTLIISPFSSPSPTPSPTPTIAPTPNSTPNPTANPTPTSTPSPTSKLTPSLDVSCKSSTTYSNFKVEINGHLTSNGTGLSDSSVLLSYSVDAGNSWTPLTLVSTDNAGDFSAAWTPLVTGNYFLKAVYTGNSVYSQAITIVNFAVLPFEEKNVFSVASNSTLSAFAFNSTSEELSFRVSGESGTIGYVDVFIPKSLMSDVSNLKVYLDGNILTSSTESQGDSWLVSFTYHLSAHEVTMYLGSAQATSAESQLGTYAIVGVVITAIAIAAILLVLRKNKKSKTKTHN